LGRESSVKIGKELRFVCEDISRNIGFASVEALKVLCLTEVLKSSSCFLKSV
jgi:hypothetical protein